MRQGYIDSQGNKYILTGVKAQFPRWTYAEWQAEGEPDIPWIRTDAPSGYRKVSGNDVSYDNTNSVNDKIDTKGDKITYSNLAITNSRGGTETNTATLVCCGEIGILDVQWKCQNAASETLTIAMPSGWGIFVNCVSGARDRTNGTLVMVWGSGIEVETYGHTGTLTVGNQYRTTMLCRKTS